MADAWIFDFDNHYYESPDAFTRYADRHLGKRRRQQIKEALGEQPFGEHPLP